MFCAGLTQLRYAVLGFEGHHVSMPTGIDHAAVRADAEGLGIDLTPRAWRGFLYCETVYLDYLAEQR